MEEAPARGTGPGRFAVGLGILAFLSMAACEQSSDVTCPPHGTHLKIAVLASLSHHFTTDCLAAPAGKPFTIYFNNQDTSLHGNHNIHLVLPGEDFVGDRAFHGTDITYTVGAIPTGTYEFHCDEHLEMRGTFIVSSAPTEKTDPTS